MNYQSQPNRKHERLSARWRKSALWLCALLLMLLPFPTGAQDKAAVLTVLYPGVEVRRANTADWLLVVQGAIMPFGVGDTVRTDERGRALLTFAVDAEALLLPQTAFTLTEYDSAGVIAEQVGRGVYRRAVSAPAAFEVITARAAVSLESGHFALEADAEATRLITAEGQATARLAAEAIAVPAGYGLRLQSVPSDRIPLEQPASFARLDGVLDGCPGLVQADGVDYLNVRVGPGNGYDFVGQIDNGTPVALLGIAPGADRYRFQFLSGFAWVLSSGIETACTDLPILPYTTLEAVIGVLQPTEIELDLLFPFFGTPEDDTWFFR
ncbi:MAG TPA: hypothetical protein PLQ56_20910 [Aggregatilineales bacterium]|nr:SH3 domain-containing protein [Anaerolineae bacterium]HUN09080.1 hypothetical protein [Aggregatilineales bacterium]